MGLRKNMKVLKESPKKQPGKQYVTRLNFKMIVHQLQIKQNTKNQKKKLNDARSDAKRSWKTKWRSTEASMENGASIWLIVILITRNDFFLEK